MEKNIRNRKQCREEGMKKELIQLLKGQEAYIQTHNFPDPDALASAFALQKYLSVYDIDATICYDGSLERANAIRMLENFGIEAVQIKQKKSLRDEAYVVLVDAQNQNANVSDLGGKKIACIDHHPIFTEYHYDYCDIQNVGACASIVASYYKEDGIAIEPNVAAALAYAIKMDTADFTRGTTALDTEMFDYLFCHADWKLVEYMYTNTLELSDLRAYEAAIQSIQICEKVGFAFIPFECQPALIAIISDFMKALDEVNIAVVYAKQDDCIRFSVRSEEENVHVGTLLKKILKGIGDGGGHPAMAGGYMTNEAAERLGDKLHQTLQERFIKEIREMRSGTKA